VRSGAALVASAQPPRVHGSQPFRRIPMAKKAAKKAKKKGRKKAKKKAKR